MSVFEALFGVNTKFIKKNCVLLPLLPRGLLCEFKLKKILRGRLYGVANTDEFSLIHTGIGASFVGDAVLHLKESACRNIILFGSCGLVCEKNGLSIGSLVVPFKSYASESFSEMLLKPHTRQRSFYPDKNLLKIFLENNKDAGVKGVSCSTISSLKLEEEMLDVFIKKGIDVLDMESSAFFSAASFLGLKSIAFFYVTDIIKKQPFYRDLDPALKSILIKKSTRLLCRFMQENLSA